ncbi:uncharacterized protein BDV17DRAFT_301361 [Aspergillus undulatus]|uniref:uncharacterized protein n=1 Tax=Aspergillus undulatus TaxID=1810928 RepID=UPI003CCD3CBE
MATYRYTYYLLSTLGGGFGLSYLAYLAFPCRSMKFTWCAQPGHARSLGMQLIDPAANPTEEESYILCILARELKSGISDEEILARFSRGFFGGWGFSPERWIAPCVQGIIDHEVFTRRWQLDAAGDSYPDTNPDTCNISHPNVMSKERLPPLGACLFGLYYLVDTNVCISEYNYPSNARPERSFVEYAGRTRGRSLAASHRFEIFRQFSGPTLGDQEQVMIIYSHVRSNPRNGGQVYSRPMTAMHVCYAHLLFADGIREVLASKCP